MYEFWRWLRLHPGCWISCRTSSLFIFVIKEKVKMNVSILFVLPKIKIYCCVGFLSIMNHLDLINVDLLGWWLSERQLPSGGLNGRPEKLQDVCYSWWVISSLKIIGKLDWINTEKLKEYILSCQDLETGID